MISGVVSTLRMSVPRHRLERRPSSDLSAVRPTSQLSASMSRAIRFKNNSSCSVLEEARAAHPTYQAAAIPGHGLLPGPEVAPPFPDALDDSRATVVRGGRHVNLTDERLREDLRPSA